MGNGTTPNMFEHHLHWRFIRETALLLVKPKMCWVKMDHERRRLAVVLF
jgi:hypothetical protein